MEKILASFRDYFDNRVAIPDALSDKGIIDDDNSGWYIRYIVLKDEHGNPYLDFTAEHRMTNPRHHRITSDGEVTFLEMYDESFSYNADIPGDKEKQRNKFYEHNQNVSRILKEKGLLDADD